MKNPVEYEPRREQDAGGVSPNPSDGASMKPILAVDPGASGGIVFLNGQGAVECHAMPDTTNAIIELLRQFTHRVELRDRVAFVENIVKHMGEGTPASRMAVYASNWGIIIGALKIVGWRVFIVRPQTWQQYLGLGITGRQRAKTKGLSRVQARDERKRIALLNGKLKREWKQRLNDEARRLFPSQSVTLKTADALLLLEYGRRVTS